MKAARRKLGWPSTTSARCHWTRTQAGARGRWGRNQRTDRPGQAVGVSYEQHHPRRQSVCRAVNMGIMIDADG